MQLSRSALWLPAHRGGVAVFNEGRRQHWQWARGGALSLGGHWWPLAMQRLCLRACAGHGPSPQEFCTAW